jgi:quercetin dioxygenase-like cupin family protein
MRRTECTRKPQRKEEDEMKAVRPNKKIVLVLAMLTAAVGVGVAVATVTSTVLTDTHPTGGLANEVRLRIVRSEFVPSPDQPAFSSGWHTHPGPVIVQVQQGRFRITDANCETTVLGPGETYIETPEQPLLVTAKKAVKWTNTFIVPANRPLATPAIDPCVDGDEDGDD